LGSVVSFEQVADLPSDSVLIDVRAPERFRGESEPVDPIAGHIPGAKNAFWQETVMGEDGKLASPQELRKRFEALGVSDANTVVHCGSGVVACQTLLALERAGFDGARLYAGGWSDWANRDGAPVATGED
jgi:thiosulfate/3-mercaptopyruvate sulfurtransferase